MDVHIAKYHFDTFLLDIEELTKVYNIKTLLFEGKNSSVFARDLLGFVRESVKENNVKWLARKDNVGTVSQYERIRCVFRSKMNTKYETLEQ